ncbi:snare-complex protein syntaxin-18 [Teratosphaeria nubilosa]|uniref:Snare-complex protein syntaxin-18 n=1 Tax=Teratosphaeria nubilosa TaxID=161662 RepID=A0A6G1LPJ9_9PEZI|nr:snare-complex protein syntaxin-18 [Teratosphaeria nubilosa]
MEVTPDFNICLTHKGAQPCIRQPYDINRINTFLQEAHTLHSRIADLTRELRALRPSYLSTAAPGSRRNAQNGRNGSREKVLTEKEKDAIDAQSKHLIRELNLAIQQLKQAEDLRYDAESQIATRKRQKGGLGALGRWAAGNVPAAKTEEEEREEAARRTIKEHREAVIYYLQKKLEEAGKLQAGIMEVRLGREVEKSKSILYKSRHGQQIPYAAEDDADLNGSFSATKNKRSIVNGYNPVLEDQKQRDDRPPELTQEQQQLFEEENTAMLKHYNSQLDQISAAEKSIREISELQSTLVSNIQLQSEHIDQLVQDSFLTTENLGRGNRELKKASERRSTAQTFFWATVGLSGFLVVWDLVF